MCLCVSVYEEKKRFVFVCGMESDESMKVGGSKNDSKFFFKKKTNDWDSDRRDRKSANGRASARIDGEKEKERANKKKDIEILTNNIRNIMEWEQLEKILHTPGKISTCKYIQFDIISIISLLGYTNDSVASVWLPVHLKSEKTERFSNGHHPSHKMTHTHAFHHSHNIEIKSSKNNWNYAKFWRAIKIL